MAAVLTFMKSWPLRQLSIALCETFTKLYELLSWALDRSDWSKTPRSEMRGGRNTNQVRPHSALNYRPSALEATIPLTLTQQSGTGII